MVVATTTSRRLGRCPAHAAIPSRPITLGGRVKNTPISAHAAALIGFPLSEVPHPTMANKNHASQAQISALILHAAPPTILNAVKDLSLS